MGPGVPNTLLIASASAASFSGVDVPWALMCSTSALVTWAVSQRGLHTGHRPGPRAKGR